MREYKCVTYIGEREVREKLVDYENSLLELELENGEFLLLIIEDQDVKKAVVNSFKYFLQASIEYSFCKYSIRFMIDYCKAIGGFLGGWSWHCNKKRLKDFFTALKVYVPKENLVMILKKHVLHVSNITKLEFDMITMLVLKKPEFRGLFVSYAGLYSGKELDEVKIIL